MRKHWGKVLFGVLVTAVLLWLLLREVSLAEIAQVFAQVNPAYVGLALLAYVLCYLFRALRFRTLLGGKLGLWQLFDIVCLHNFFTSLLPARSGELSYLYLAHRRGIPLAEGIATLLLSRLFDFLTITVIFFLAIPLLPALPLLIRQALWAITLFLVLIALFIVLLLWLGEAFLDFLRKVFVSLRLHRLRFLSTAMQKLREGVVAASALRSPARIGSVLLTSIGIWVFQYLTYGSLVKAMALPVNLLAVVVAMSFISVASAIPIQGIAGFGVNEGWWSLSYAALGLEKTLAISSGFVQHIIIVVFYSVLAAIGWLLFLGEKPERGRATAGRRTTRRTS